jgi:hypothetical protein
MLNAAQIIAFGFAALETLDEAKASEVSPSMRLRYRGCANNLNRSCQRNEKALASQLSRDVPPAPQPHAEPIDDVPEAHAAEMIRLAETAIQTHRNAAAASRATEPQPTPASQIERRNRVWGGAMMGALAGMGMPVQLVAPEKPGPV